MCKLISWSSIQFHWSSFLFLYQNQAVFSTVALHCWWECKLVQLLWISVWQFLRKLGNNPPQDPAISLLVIYPKDAKSYHKDICSTTFIAALFVMARTWKQPKCASTEEWIRKIWYIYKLEYYTTEKKWHLEICRKMDGSRKHPIAWGNPDPERQSSYALTHKWFLNIKWRKPAPKSQSQRT